MYTYNVHIMYKICKGMSFRNNTETRYVIKASLKSNKSRKSGRFFTKVAYRNPIGHRRSFALSN